MNEFILLSQGPNYREYWRPLVMLSTEREVNMRIHFYRDTAEIILYIVETHDTIELHREKVTPEDAKAVLETYGYEQGGTPLDSWIATWQRQGGES